MRAVRGAVIGVDFGSAGFLRSKTHYRSMRAARNLCLPKTSHPNEITSDILELARVAAPIHNHAIAKTYS